MTGLVNSTGVGCGMSNLRDWLLEVKQVLELTVSDTITALFQTSFSLHWDKVVELCFNECVKVVANIFGKKINSFFLLKFVNGYYTT